jgi:hypothetical protein
MTWVFAPVPGDEAPAVWSDAWPCLKPAVEMMEGKFDERAVLDLIRLGNLQLWIASSLEGESRIAVVTELVLYPLQKWCRIVFVGGKGLSNAFDFLGTIEDWAKTQGCVGLETGGRPEWGRPLSKFGYSERARSYQRKFDA